MYTQSLFFAICLSLSASLSVSVCLRICVPLSAALFISLSLSYKLRSIALQYSVDEALKIPNSSSAQIWHQGAIDDALQLRLNNELLDVWLRRKWRRRRSLWRKIILPLGGIGNLLSSVGRSFQRGDVVRHMDRLEKLRRIKYCIMFGWCILSIAFNCCIVSSCGLSTFDYRCISLIKVKRTQTRAHAHTHLRTHIHTHWVKDGRENRKRRIRQSRVCRWMAKSSRK